MTLSDKDIESNGQARTRQRAGISVSLRSVRPVLAYMSACGHNVIALLRSQSMDPMLLQDPEARAPHAVAVSIWQAAVQLTNDPGLGLHIAEKIQPGEFGVLDYTLRTSGTLGAGFSRLSRYHRLFHDAAEVKLEVVREHFILSHRLPLPGGAPRQVSEFIIAAWLTASRQATGVECTPEQVYFPHPAPPDTSEHQRVFGCPVKFGHWRSELVLPRRFLDLPLVKADPILQGILEEQVEALLGNLPRAEATTDAIRRFLAVELSNGQPRLEQLAPRLHMSARTLHRRLEQEGTNFRRILTEVRHELAVRHLLERRLAIGEIAFLLGFSEVSAFHRAFKHWTGHAPHAYRALHSSAQSSTRNC